MENPGKNSQKKRHNSLKIYAKYSGIAFQMAAIILLGLFGGIKLDEFLELSTPVFTVLFTFIGFGAALFYLFKGITK